MRWKRRGDGSNDELVRVTANGRDYELAVRHELRVDWSTGQFIDEWRWLIDELSESEEGMLKRTTIERGSVGSKRVARKRVKEAARARKLTKRFDLAGAISIVWPRGGQVSIKEKK